MSNPEYRKKKTDYMRKWREENPERTKENEYMCNHSEKRKIRYSKYYNSIKGIVNRLRKNDYKKFGEHESKITVELIQMVNERDKFCVYCHKLLENNGDWNDIHYDHINPYKPLSETNIVRCCGKCNHQKSSGDALQWCEFMGYKPAEIVLQLIEKDKAKFLNKLQ